MSRLNHLRLALVYRLCVLRLLLDVWLEIGGLWFGELIGPLLLWLGRVHVVFNVLFEILERNDRYFQTKAGKGFTEKPTHVFIDEPPLAVR